jgi:hypothetical protein
MPVIWRRQVRQTRQFIRQLSGLMDQDWQVLGADPDRFILIGKSEQGRHRGCAVTNNTSFLRHKFYPSFQRLRSYRARVDLRRVWFS